MSAIAMKFCRVGNSLGFRVPAEVKRKLGVDIGDEALLELVGEEIVIRLSKRVEELTLDDMFVGFKPEMVARTPEDNLWLGASDVGGEQID